MNVLKIRGCQELFVSLRYAQSPFYTISAHEFRWRKKNFIQIPSNFFYLRFAKGLSLSTKRCYLFESNSA
jgi:hypothetical protein